MKILPTNQKTLVPLVQAAELQLPQEFGNVMTLALDL